MSRKSSATLFAGWFLVATALIATVRPARALDLSKLLPGRASEAAPGLKLIHVADLSAIIGRHPRDLFIYDANPTDVRAEYGVIPGARMLPSADDYNVAATLPSDKRDLLVFYCHDPH